MVKSFFNNIFYATLLFGVLMSAVTSCKKGEDDPFFSLHSRKARVVGEWDVSSYSETASDNGGNVESISFNGSSFTRVQNGTPTSVPGTFKVKFKKDGTYSTEFSMALGSNSSTYTETGTWNFTGRVGELKNKSQILLTPLSKTTVKVNGLVQTVDVDTYSGASAPFQLLTVKELRNKKIVFVLDGTTGWNYSNGTNTGWTNVSGYMNLTR